MDKHSAVATSNSETPSILDMPRDPRAVALAAYWRSKCAGRPMPDRKDIDPAEIVALLPNIFISEALNGGAEFRFRIFGTALVNLIGAELTGKSIADLSANSIVIDTAAAALRWKSISRMTFDTARPVSAAGRLINTVHRTLEWESFSAPLTVGGDGIGQIVGGLFFGDIR
ncbi:MAG: PAS domain-containing protein [Parvibaculum sp.]|uniref:PAS domain-containing protein n=1 Tax=Parvibaculum sp. TaxID=2024848 RepID=UPI0025F80EF1|nr:PAS domain-containing protein [Parvibaculum sp.]MCE9648556.1 PAS domain-containing protein [Parvibaculum sp.]